MKKVLICADKKKFPLPIDKFINYRNAFTQLGAEVVVSADPSVCAECDMLLLPGGEDVHPKRYGQEINGSIGINEGRDDTEFSIIDSFISTNRPILGICRGEQVLNVYFGGTLLQHIPNHGRVGIPPWDSVHMVRTEDPLLQKLYGESFSVNSAHAEIEDGTGSRRPRKG